MHSGDRVRLRKCVADCPQGRFLGTLIDQVGGGRRAWYVDLRPVPDLCPDGGVAEVREALIEVVPEEPRLPGRRLVLVTVGELGYGVTYRIVEG